MIPSGNGGPHNAYGGPQNHSTALVDASNPYPVRAHDDQSRKQQLVNQSVQQQQQRSHYRQPRNRTDSSNNNNNNNNNGGQPWVPQNSACVLTTQCPPKHENQPTQPFSPMESYSSGIRSAATIPLPTQMNHAQTTFHPRQHEAVGPTVKVGQHSVPPPQASYSGFVQHPQQLPSVSQYAQHCQGAVGHNKPNIQHAQYDQASNSGPNVAQPQTQFYAEQQQLHLASQPQMASPQYESGSYAAGYDQGSSVYSVGNRGYASTGTHPPQMQQRNVTDNTAMIGNAYHQATPGVQHEHPVQGGPGGQGNHSYGTLSAQPHIAASATNHATTLMTGGIGPNYVNTANAHQPPGVFQQQQQQQQQQQMHQQQVQQQVQQQQQVDHRQQTQQVQVQQQQTYHHGQTQNVHPAADSGMHRHVPQQQQQQNYGSVPLQQYQYSAGTNIDTRTCSPQLPRSGSQPSTVPLDPQCSTSHTGGYTMSHTVHPSKSYETNTASRVGPQHHLQQHQFQQRHGNSGNNRVSRGPPPYNVTSPVIQQQSTPYGYLNHGTQFPTGGANGAPCPTASPAAGETHCTENYVPPPDREHDEARHADVVSESVQNSGASHTRGQQAGLEASGCQPSRCMTPCHGISSSTSGCGTPQSEGIYLTGPTMLSDLQRLVRRCSKAGSGGGSKGSPVSDQGTASEQLDGDGALDGGSVLGFGTIGESNSGSTSSKAVSHKGHGQGPHYDRRFRGANDRRGGAH